MSGYGDGSREWVYGEEDGAQGGRAPEERTFAALPPAPGRGFAQTWWGLAWLKALEDTALDGGQLKAGRRYAREGAVGAVSVRPGRITAVVRDPDGTSHRGDVLWHPLSEDDWDRFLGMAVERAGHIAALLDRDMPPHLVEDAASAGVELLPGIGDLEPECTCGAWDHCPHTAALCYQMARLLDQDPFVLLLMRGRGERTLLAELEERSAAPRSAEPEVPAGVPAAEVFAARDVVPPLPGAPETPAEAGAPPRLDTETPPGRGVDAAALEFLAADAARRAREMLAEALAPGHASQPLTACLTPGQDAVRLAVECADPQITARLAAGSGRRPAGLDLAVQAWRYGGAASLSVLEEEWPPGPEALARAKDALARAWQDEERPVLRASGANRWTVVGGGAQLRFGRDGRWWPYRKERGAWVPAGPADTDPGAVLER
ncbi:MULTISPECIES: SWF or SNF family helicase [unclassified Streptomyces]|uniref:SWIM zinc finger family protein n=1 Tax=unclassified Streptomyces TaxID=2593676 RepID=UPI0033D9FC3A